MKPTVLIAALVSEFMRGRLAERYAVHGPFEGSEVPAGEARNARVLVTLGGRKTDARADGRAAAARLDRLLRHWF